MQGEYGLPEEKSWIEEAEKYLTVRAIDKTVLPAVLLGMLLSLSGSQFDRIRLSLTDGSYF